MTTYLCDSCHGSCCRAYRLTITIFDFLDLINSVGFEEACKGIAFESVPYNENVFANQRLMFPFVFDDLENSDKQMYLLCLKRVASELIPNTQQCYFFKEEKRSEKLINPELPNHAEHLGSDYKGWCGVYENRPTMCRTYPIGLNLDTYQSFLSRRDENKGTENIKALQLCPKKELALEDFGLQDKNAYMKKVNDLLLNETRTKAHNAAVLKWNSQPKRSIKSVVKFFQNVGGSLILTKQQIQQNQKTPIVPQVITSAVQKLEHKKDLVK